MLSNSKELVGIENRHAVVANELQVEALLKVGVHTVQQNWRILARRCPKQHGPPSERPSSH